jgi:crotonobetainyl-CoA:carnitine CoA-transferase CaiB-like acyl-CoA transferase
MLGGRVGAKTCRALVEWMDSEGMADEYIKGINWENLDIARISQEDIDKISSPIEKFFLSRTKKELWEGAVSRRMTMCPLFEPEDLLKDPQLQARDFWVEMNHPELETTLFYPKGFVELTEGSCSIRNQAPRIGEHNSAIYSELGLSLEEQTALKEREVI